MAAHARLSPSSSARYLRCPGSVNFAADIEEDGGGIPADEGTILHAIGEDALRTDKDAYDYIGEVWEYGQAVLEFNDDLADYMQPGLDRIRAFDAEKIYIEHRVDLSRWMPDQFGTLDVGVILRDEDEVVIWDWKWGYNPVKAVENDQLRIYALGFWDNIVRHIAPHIKSFRLIIEQPRAPGGGGEWVVSLRDLKKFGRWVEERASMTYDEDAPRIAGTVQCAYCPGARNLSCPEYNAFNAAMIVREFEELDELIEDGLPFRTPNIKSLTIEQKCFIVDHRSMIDKYLDRIHADVLDDALRGAPTPGQKAVYGRNPPRKWREVEVVESRLKRVLGEDAYTKKLLSPTQAEKTLPPRQYAKLTQYVDRGEPKVILVSDQDERPSVKTIVDLFDDD